MSSIPPCDILHSITPNILEPKKFYAMSRKSVRTRALALEKEVQNNRKEQVSPKTNKTKNRAKAESSGSIIFDEKPTIDILSKVMSDDSKRKRKSTSEQYVLDKNVMFAKKQIKVENDNQEQENIEHLSEYEKMCRQNIEEKRAFFASLNFDEVKQDVLSASSLLKPKPKPKPKKVALKKKEPLRKSLRLQRISADTVSLRDQPVPKIENTFEPAPQKPHRLLTFEEVFKSENQSSEELLKDLSVLSTEKITFEPFPYSRYESNFASMKIYSSSIAKVAKSRICSLAVHPSTCKTLVCAGSKYGRLSFWDVESENPQGGVYVYEPHSRAVGCVAFNMDLPHQVVSCSYDGTVRCGHLEVGVFDEVYHTNEDGIVCTYFDFHSPYTLLVALTSGEIGIVDTRTPTDEKKVHRLTHPFCPVKTVSVHPVQKDYFIAAGRNGIVSLWDLRLTKRTSITDMVHPRCVNSAFFSPVTGNFVLTTSMDNKLSLFDSSSLDQKISLKKSIRHDNFTGRWLTTFRAVWLPNNEDAFVVGSMLYPRRIEVYHVNGQLSHNFSGEDLASICSANAFHPSKPVLAGGNSSGKLHIFIGQ